MQTGTVFETPILQHILRIQNLHQVGHCAFLEVTRSFPQVGCVCKKQTSVSHNSTESEIICAGRPVIDCSDTCFREELRSHTSSAGIPSNLDPASKEISNAKENSWKY